MRITESMKLTMLGRKTIIRGVGHEVKKLCDDEKEKRHGDQN